MSSYEHRTSVRLRLAVIKRNAAWLELPGVLGCFAGLSCLQVAVGSTTSFTRIHFNFAQVREDFEIKV